MTTLVVGLKRINLQFFRNRNPNSNDFAQVPASGATYTVLRQGATVRTSTIFANSSTWIRVDVFSVGRIRPGDHLQLANIETSQFTVVHVNATEHWLEVFPFTENDHLSAGDRLVVLNDPPKVFSDIAGSAELPSNTITLDSRGRASFFCGERLHDALLVGADDTQLFLDVEGGSYDNSILNARNFPSIQEAIDSLTLAGGTVFVPSGVWDQTTPIVFPLDRPVRLLGNGPSSTILRWRLDPTGVGEDESDGLIRIRGSRQSLESLQITGPGQIADAVRNGPGYGVVIGRRVDEGISGSEVPLKEVRIFDCDINQTTSWLIRVYGIRAFATSSGWDSYDAAHEGDRWADAVHGKSSAILGTIENTSLSYNKYGGVLKLGRGANTWNLQHLNIGATYGYQLYVDGGAEVIRCSNCAFDTPVTDDYEKIVLSDVVSVTIDTCDFENGICKPTVTDNNGVVLSATPPCIKIRNTNNRGVTVLNCTCYKAPDPSNRQNAGMLSSTFLSVPSDASAKGVKIIGLNLHMNLGLDNQDPPRPIASQSKEDIAAVRPETELHVIGGTRTDETASGIENLRLNSNAHRTAILKTSPRHGTATNQTISNGQLTAITELQHALLASKKYAYRFMIAFSSSNATVGIQVTVSVAPPGINTIANVIGTVKTLFQNDGYQALWAGAITSSLDTVVVPSLPQVDTLYLIEIDGLIVTGDQGAVLQPMLANGSGSTLTINDASFGTVTEVQ